MPVASDVPYSLCPPQEVEKVIDIGFRGFHNAHQGETQRTGRHGKGSNLQALAAENIHQPADGYHVVVRFKRQ
jgi:hypothetical protein